MSVRARMGASAAEASRWQSDSTVECRWSMGAGRTLGMMVTASGGMGSISEGYSYSGVGAGAGGSEGSEQVNVRGVGEGGGVRILAGGSLGMGAVTARGRAPGGRAWR